MKVYTEDVKVRSGCSLLRESAWKAFESRVRERCPWELCILGRMFALVFEIWRVRRSGELNGRPMSSPFEGLLMGH